MELNSSDKGPFPALPDLFAWSEGKVQLISARCTSCGTYFFPAYHEQHRPGCKRKGIENILLDTHGILASYTIQHYMPPPPFITSEDITPYAIGLVEFPEGIQVVGILVDADLETLAIDSKVETTIYELYKDDDQRAIVTWGFRVLPNSEQGSR